MDGNGDGGLEKVWTFAWLSGRYPGVLRRRARKRFNGIVEAISELEGLVGVTAVNPAMLIHMTTKNDAIIGRNRLRFLGAVVSEEIVEIPVGKIKRWDGMELYYVNFLWDKGVKR